MARYWENDHYIRDLQEAATLEADRRIDPESVSTGETVDITSSRAAMLSLVDRLSAVVSRQLVFLAGASLMLAAIFLFSLAEHSFSSIGRLVLWGALVLSTIFYAWQKVRSFKFGFGYSGKPFTWRSDYTCILAITSTTFGAGAVLLTPEAVTPTTAIVISTLTVLSALLFGYGHLSWGPAAASSSLPAVILAILALLFHVLPLTPETQPGLAILAGTVLLTSVCYLGGFRRAQKISADALLRHPRNATHQVKSRHKKTSGAYNPYRIRAKTAPSSRPAALEAERAVTGSNRSH
ncbi:MAG: hypothetical protein MRY59_03750 [Aquisalinus sp.]|nr:hypothetical protein [Aquisalinus sp.]